MFGDFFSSYSFDIFFFVVVAFTFPSSFCSSFALSSRVHNTRRSFYSTSKTFLKSYYLFKLLTFFLFVDNAINLFELYFLCMCARCIFFLWFFSSHFSFVLECILLRVQRIRYEHLQALYWCSGRFITLILLSHRSALICSFRFWYLFLINKQNFMKFLHEKMPFHWNYSISLSSMTDNSKHLSLYTIALLNSKKLTESNRFHAMLIDQNLFWVASLHVRMYMMTAFDVIPFKQVPIMQWTTHPCFALMTIKSDFSFSITHFWRTTSTTNGLNEISRTELILTSLFEERMKLH